MQIENDEEIPENDLPEESGKNNSTEQPRKGFTFNELFSQFDVYTKINDNIQKAVDGFNQATINIAKKWAESFDPYKIVLERLEEFVKAFPQLEKEAIDVLNRYHWLPFEEMPTTFLVKLVELSRKPGNHTRVVNQMFVAYFKSNDYKNLVEMVDSWKDNPLFAGRMKILRDCAQVVRLADGNYNAANVVLPTLIAQIDGILTEFGEQKGEAAASTRKAEFARWLRHHTQNEYFADTVNQFILNILFRQTKDKKQQEVKIPYRYNRHKVLHGQHLHYGRMPELLRTFLVLDYLAKMKI